MKIIDDEQPITKDEETMTYEYGDDAWGEGVIGDLGAWQMQGVDSVVSDSKRRE